MLRKHRSALKMEFPLTLAADLGNAMASSKLFAERHENQVNSLAKKVESTTAPDISKVLLTAPGDSDKEKEEEHPKPGILKAQLNNDGLSGTVTALKLLRRVGVPL